MIWPGTKDCPLRRRVRSYDTLDWALFALTLTFIASLSVVLYAAIHPSRNEWFGLSYVLPAQVISEANEFNDVYTSNDEIPVRLTRITDCATYTCPEGALPTEVTVRWQLLEDGDLTITVFTVLDAFKVSLVEGEGYRVGEYGINTTQLAPFPVPDEVIEWNEQNGGSSTWRIEGFTEPLIEGASPVAWQTQSFVVVNAAS